MDLVDRYVNDVRTFLPRGRSRTTSSMSFPRTSAPRWMTAKPNLGDRSPRTEQETILQQHGHPMIVAGRYQPNQGSVAFGRQLIGTALFPFYLRVLGIAMGDLVRGLPRRGRRADRQRQSGHGRGRDELDPAAGLLPVWRHHSDLRAGGALPADDAVERAQPAREPSLRRATNNAGQISRLESIAQIVALLVLLVWLRSRV